MFQQVLPGTTKDLLALLGKSVILGDFYLAGGTGLALQLGHRISRDLDFFTPREFDTDILVQRLQGLGAFTLEQQGWGTVLGKFPEIKFSAFYYRYPLVAPTVTWQGIAIADVQDIASMKLAAIAGRGKKRDFIDLFFILKTIPLKRAFELYDQKYENMRENAAHILRSLTYFVDAEEEDIPEMLTPVSWDEVKRVLEREAKELAAELLGRT